MFQIEPVYGEMHYHKKITSKGGGGKWKCPKPGPYNRLKPSISIWKSLVFIPYHTVTLINCLNANYPSICLQQFLETIRLMCSIKNDVEHNEIVVWSLLVIISVLSPEMINWCSCEGWTWCFSCRGISIHILFYKSLLTTLCFNFGVNSTLQLYIMYEDDTPRNVHWTLTQHLTSFTFPAITIEQSL